MCNLEFRFVGVPSQCRTYQKDPPFYPSISQWSTCPPATLFLGQSRSRTTLHFVYCDVVLTLHWVITTSEDGSVVQSISITEILPSCSKKRARTSLLDTGRESMNRGRIRARTHEHFFFLNLIKVPADSVDDAGNTALVLSDLLSVESQIQRSLILLDVCVDTVTLDHFFEVWICLNQVVSVSVSETSVAVRICFRRYSTCDQTRVWTRTQRNNRSATDDVHRNRKTFLLS